MRNQSETSNNVPVPSSETVWDIRSFLRYEQERPDVVSLRCDWEGDVPRKTLDAVMQILQGEYPDEVFLAELPRAGAWTRKLKLFVPGQDGRMVTIIGGGAPRLWLGKKVAYQLPNPHAGFTTSVYRHYLSEETLSTEKVSFDEVQGGLSLALSKHIQERMTQALALTHDGISVPTLVARGRLTVPGWEGAFLVYSEVINRRPGYYLRPESRHRRPDVTQEVEILNSGVRVLFETLRKINVRAEGGIFHGDLVHRLRGGSANLGFTQDGDVVITGWGGRMDEQVQDWPPEGFRKHQLRETMGALAGLAYEIMNSDLSREERQRLVVETVQTGLQEYTGHHRVIDRVTLAAGLPTDMDRSRKTSQRILSDYDFRDLLFETILYQESGQLEEEMKRWLVKCVTRHV